MQMRKIIKTASRFLNVLTISAMILSTLGALTIAPREARAAITASGAYDLLPSGGMSVPASSYDLAILRFALNQSNSETLSSVAVTIGNNSGGAVTNDTLAGHIGNLLVWKDGNGNNFFDGINGDLLAGTQNVIRVATSTTAITTSSNNTIANNTSLPTSFFVTLQVDSDWAAGDNILVSIAANGVTTSANSPTITALTGAKPIFFGTGGGGGHAGFYISNVSFVNSTTVDVQFNDTLNLSSGTATSTANYTLATAAGGDNSTVTSVIVLPDNKSVRVAAAGAVIASTGTDTITVNNQVKNHFGNVNSTTGAMPIMSANQPLLISEIKVGTAADQYDEFVEIYNRSAGAVTVTNLRLHIVNASGGADVNAPISFLAATSTIAANGFMLIAPRTSPASSTADGVYTSSTLANLAPSGAAYISYSAASSTTVIDRVCWGSHTPTSDCEGSAAAALANDGTSLERKAFNASTASTMAVGGADAGQGNGVDTQNNSYDFVTRAVSLPQNRSMAAEAPSGGSYGGASNGAPSIMLGPLFNATRDSALNLIARISDDGGPVPAGNTQLIFCTTNTTCTPASSTPIYGVSIGSGWYKFSSTSSDWASSRSSMKYYLQASDSATPAKTSVFTNDPNYDAVTFSHDSDGIPTAALQLSKALTTNLTTGNLGSASINGLAQDSSGAAIASATVWIEGTQFAATTGNDGAFSFSNIGPVGGGQLKIAKDGYMDQSVSIFIPSSGLVSLPTITLYSGTMGQGGDFSLPRVTNSFPMMNMTGFPTQTPSGGPQHIELNFSKNMDATTITDTDASDASSNIYLTTAGSQTKIAGAVTAPTATQARFTPAAALVVGQAYTLYMTPAVKDSVGNPVSGNTPQGAYILNFSTAGQMFSSVGDIGASFGMGSAFPPFVIGSQPAPGKANVSLNSKAFMTFSESMQNSAGNLANVKLYKVTGAFSASEAKTLVTTTNSLDTSGKIVILTPSAALVASSHYRLEVLSGITSSKGISMGNPNQAGFATNIIHRVDFDTGTASDTTAPTVSGTVPADSATAVSIVKQIIISFGEAINPSTITDSSVTLKLGSTSVSGNLSYNSNNWTATFAPNYFLTPTSTYTITVTSDVQDLAGNALDQDSNTAGNQSLLRTFTTGGVDTSSPTVTSAQANDFALKVTFSKPMMAVASGDINYAYSVLNPTNYSVRVVNSSGVTQSTLTLPATATVSYDAAARNAAINGLPSISGFTAGTTLMNIVVSNVKDSGYNNLAAAGNAATSTAQSSATTGSFSGGGGMMMPMVDSSGNMIQGGMFGPPTTAIKTFTDSGIGFIPSAKVFPFSPMAGVSTIYGVELPISKQVPAGGYIDITFPDGTDVSQAKKDVYSPPNNDLNGPGPGTVVFATSEGTLPSGWTTGGVSNDGVIVNSSSPVVRIILGAVATRCGTGNTDPCVTGDQHDFLHFDIAQIMNSTLSTQGNDTTGNSATIETKKSDGTVVETLSSGSFYTAAAGTYTLRGRLLSGASGINGVNVYLMSPLTGPQTTSTANGRYGVADGEFMFQNLPEGNYMLGADKFFTVGGTSYTSDFPGPAVISSAKCTSSVCTQNISVSSAAAGATVTLSITGVFSNDAVDIFAAGPSGFRMATTTLNGTLTNNTSNTLRLNSNGVWMVGFGPAMSQEIFGKAKSFVAPAWMIPKPVEVLVTGCPSACAINPGTVSFNVSAANKTIKFTVKDASSNAIGNAHVFAYSPIGGLGSDTQANADGTGSLSLSYGSYKIGADVAGMPGTVERSISIRSVSGTDKVFVDGSSSGITLSSMAVSDLILTISKPSYTISGKVTDGTNALANVPVNAYRTNGPGHAETFTNSSGDYTLYVNNGIWKVQAFTPQFGKLAEKTVTISGSNSSGKNFEPNTASVNYGTITKSVTVDTDSSGTYSASADEELSNVQVVVEGTTSAGEAYVNAALTDTNGSSTFKLPPGTYTMKAISPTLGQLPAFSSTVIVNSSGTVTQEPSNLLAPQTGAVVVNILDSEGATTSTPKAVVEFSQIGGKMGNAESFSNVASSTFSLPIYDAGASPVAINSSTSTSPANFYLLRVNIPGVSAADLNVYGADGNTIMATSTSVNGLWKVEIDGNETINVKMPAMSYISGTVKDASGTAIPDAIVHLENSTTGDTYEVQADSSGNYSGKVSSATYLMKAEKDGYIDTASSVTISGSGALADSAATMSAAAYTISGTIRANGSAVSGAAVKGLKLGGGVVEATTATDGTYSLGVIAGNWKISASYEGYSEATYSGIVTVGAANITGTNITLSSTNSSLAGSTSLSLTPQTGGALSDTTANLGIDAPKSAISRSSDSYSMNEKETSNVVAGGSGKPIGGEAKSISIYDNGGSTVPRLDKDIAVSASYTTAELTSSLGTSLTLAKADEIKMGSWDDTASDWQHLTTTVSYKDSSGNYVEPASNLSNVSTVQYTGQTSHLSVFNPIAPADGLAPAVPTGVTAAGSSGSVALSWTAPTTNANGTALSDLLGYEVYRSTKQTSGYEQINTSNVTGTSFTDGTVTNGTEYYYQITAADTGGLESDFSVVSNSVNPGTTAPSRTSGGGGAAIVLAPTVTTPTNASISIKSGAAEANAADVVLTLSATGAAQMKISNLSSFSGAAWETYASEKIWKLSAGLGKKTVYAKFKSSSGGESSVVSDDIMLLPLSAAKSISASAGGKVGLADNLVAVDMPAGTVSKDTNITIAPTTVYTAPTGKNKLLGNQAYDLKAESEGASVKTFNKDLTIAFKYTSDDLKGLAEGTLAVHYWDETAKKWVKLETVVDKVNKTASAKVNHFTLFAVFGEESGMSGSLVKLKCDAVNKTVCSAVYYIGNDGKRYVFPNEKTYFTWYSDFAAVKEITASELASYAIGGNATYKPGVRMVKIQSDLRVYAISKGGILREIASEAVAKALYGALWNKQIDDISDAFFVNYKTGTKVNVAGDYKVTDEKTAAANINTDKGL